MNFTFLVGGIKTMPSYKQIGLSKEKGLSFLLAISNETFGNPTLIPCVCFLDGQAREILKYAFPGVVVAIIGKLNSFPKKIKDKPFVYTFLEINQISFLTKQADFSDLNYLEFLQLNGLDKYLDIPKRGRKKKEDDGENG